MEPTLGVISAEQRISEKVLLPYLKPVQGVGISGAHYITLRTNKSVDRLDKCYIFEFPVLHGNLIDLAGVLLSIKGKLLRVKAGGGYENMPKLEQAMCVNNSAHSLFESVTVNMGMNQESFYLPMYPHRAMMRQLLRYKSPRPSTGVLEGFEYSFESTNEDINSERARSAVYSESKDVEFLGLYQLKYLHIS